MRTSGPVTVPIIDLFAGPGGLSEGFATYSPGNANANPFKILASVEMDRYAHKTLELRSFFHEFTRNEVPDEYYMHLRQEITKDELFALYPIQATAARKRAILGTLGSPDDDPRIYRNIEQALTEHKGKPWVLVGGPPCQAYSLIGRSRRQAKGIGQKTQQEDKRNFLYLEYLNIISKFEPAVFIMENVKGILSAEVDGVKMFPRILQDLRNPQQALLDSMTTPRFGGSITGRDGLAYAIHSLVVPTNDETPLSPMDYLIKSENYGVPQARHRVILLGIRSDINVKPTTLLPQSKKIAVRTLLKDLPAVRSSFSRTADVPSDWYDFLAGITQQSWYKKYTPAVPTAEAVNTELLKSKMDDAIAAIQPGLDTGKEFISQQVRIDYRPDWFIDERLGGVVNHSARPHMKEDLYRYFYAAAYTEAFGKSPRIKNFPVELLPKHSNVSRSLDKGAFDDRFKVQEPNRPSSTITCHISKDGHYNIHYNASQCRSLTVREAARLQSFPDNYYFCGPRTQQYHQVGNAVPPILASQIAEVVYDVISRISSSDSKTQSNAGKIKKSDNPVLTPVNA